jgi:hypothetical protein
MHNPEAHESAPQQAGAKKSYHSPELKLHGTVQEQTLASSPAPTHPDATAYS